jgi:hypothetical protein
MRAMNAAPKLLGMLLLAAALAALLGGRASAQIMPKFSLQDGEKKLTPEEQEKKRQLDDAYKSATNKIPDQQANDPWAGVRPTPAAPSGPTPKKKQQ